MSEQEFYSLCKYTVLKYVKDNHLALSDKEMESMDIYVVWMCKTLQNNKALLSTSLRDCRYYEITYNGDKNQLYLDVYEKWENRCYNLDSDAE